jgi:hypothetical protein
VILFPKGRRGTTLVLNLFVMVVFAATAAIVYKSAKTMVGETVYFERSAQAQALAESGLEDALHSLYSTATWRTGFNQKALGTGYYTVSVATISALSIQVVSSGYSASIFGTGRAVKSVTATVQFVSTSAVTDAVMSNDLTVNGTVDAYDPRVNVSPSATDFIDGGTIWAENIGPTSACGSVRIKSNVLVYNAAAPSLGGSTYPGSGCVNTPTDTITSTTSHVSLPMHTCDATCQALAAPYLAQINVDNPLTTPYNPGGGGTLTVGQDQVVTIASGTYYLKSVAVNKGTLNVNTTFGPVYIYYTNSFSMTSNASHPCAINNTSKFPSQFLIADVSGSHTVTLNCPGQLHAYLEGSANHFTVQSGQEVFGHFSGADTTIDAGGKLHFDASQGYSANHVTWTTGSSGSWSEGYKRQ